LDFDKLSTAGGAALRYTYSSGFATDEVRDILCEFEGTASEEIRRRRDRLRETNRRQRVTWLLYGSRRAAERGVDDWSREMVLRVAREQCEILGAAVAVIQRGGDDEENSLLSGLAEYLAGNKSTYQFKSCLERLGYSSSSNVVPLFVPARRS
jgi:hypothetical protein